MKRVRFTEEQIIAVLREHDAGAKTADLARKHGISEATLYNWKAKYGGMDGVGRQASAVSGRGEPQAEEALGEVDARSGSAEGASLSALPRGRSDSPQAQGSAKPNPGRGQGEARWSLDFVHDQLAQGRRFRILNIVDDVTRELPGGNP